MVLLSLTDSAPPLLLLLSGNHHPKRYVVLHVSLRYEWGEKGDQAFKNSRHNTISLKFVNPTCLRSGKTKS